MNPGSDPLEPMAFGFSRKPMKSILTESGEISISGGVGMRDAKDLIFSVGANHITPLNGLGVNSDHVFSARVKVGVDALEGLQKNMPPTPETHELQEILAEAPGVKVSYFSESQIPHVAESSQALKDGSRLFAGLVRKTRMGGEWTSL